MLEALTISTPDPFGVGRNLLLCITPCMAEDELKINWRDIRNHIATEYQTADIDDFKRWNFYIFYVVVDKNKIDRSLKYEIEHDTISSRKIVINQNEFACNVDNLVNKYIRFNFGNMVNHDQVKSFVKEPEVSIILKELKDEN